MAISKSFFKLFSVLTNRSKRMTSTSERHFFETQFMLIWKVDFWMYWSFFVPILKYSLTLNCFTKQRRQFFTILIIMYYFEETGVFVYGTLRCSGKESTFETASDWQSVLNVILHGVKKSNYSFLKQFSVT